MLHKVPAVLVGVQTAVHSHSRQHEGTFRPFSRLLRQAVHTVGQFCTPKGDPGTTGGVTSSWYNVQMEVLVMEPGGSVI